MEQKFCIICGAEIYLHYVRPAKVFRITQQGKIMRADNNDAWNVNSDDPYFVAVCNCDATHEVYEQDGIPEWCDELEFEIKSRWLGII